MKKLPVIDIAPLYDVNHPDYADICNQIDQACREWGFFYICLLYTSDAADD